MAKRDTYEARTEELLLPIIAEHNFELVDVEYVKEAGTWYLRAYVDKEGGISIDDCEVVSRALEAKLDETDFIEDAYILEISSPGLTRPLKKDKDYTRNIGKLIEFRLFQPVEGSREYTATLISFDAKSIVVETAGKNFTVERSNLAMIRQAFVD